MEGFVCIDGEIVPAREAGVPVSDRGLLYGDGLFETMRVEEGRVHLRERHLRRLVDAAGMLEITLPEIESIREALRATVDANRLASGILRLTLTRGIQREGLGGDTERSTLIVSQRPLLQSQNQTGRQRLITLERRLSPPDTPTRIKSTSHLTYVLAAREAAHRGADEGVMLTPDGLVAEGTIANIFIVRGGVLLTAPISLGVLPGIARGRVLELAAALGIEAREIAFDREALHGADECFFTNAARGVVVAGSVDGIALAADAPIGTRLALAYREEMANEEL